MEPGQQLNKRNFFERASIKQRFAAGAVLLTVGGLFCLLGLDAVGKVDIGLLLGPCGFKLDYGLPCPGCEITTAAVAFVQGKIFRSFYIQPAGALLCCILLFGGFSAFLTAVFGVYLRFLKCFFEEVKVRYIVLTVIIIIIAGWAVTLARAIAEKSQM